MMDEKYFREVGMGTELVFLSKTSVEKKEINIRRETDKVLKREIQIKDRE